MGGATGKSVIRTPGRYRLRINNLVTEVKIPQQEHSLSEIEGGWNCVKDTEMNIGQDLVIKRWRLISNHRLGFGCDPALVPRPGMVTRLKELRQEEFLNFRKGLREENVVIFKVVLNKKGLVRRS